MAYFPQTVLTGAIGAIGVSLFVLGLGLPFPPSSTPLSLGNVASTLFAKSHLGLLAASFLPAFILSVTLRFKSLELWTRGLVRSAYYIPTYLLCIPVVFWIAVQSLRISKEQLIATGWLFTVDSTSTSARIVASWNYWTLFNFVSVQSLEHARPLNCLQRLVEWWSLKSAIQNIVLLVVIGYDPNPKIASGNSNLVPSVVNLPVFVPALAVSLDVAYDMNHELLGVSITWTCRLCSNSNLYQGKVRPTSSLAFSVLLPTF